MNLMVISFNSLYSHLLQVSTLYLEQTMYCKHMICIYSLLDLLNRLVNHVLFFVSLLKCQVLQLGCMFCGGRFTFICLI